MSEQEAAARLERHGPNRLPQPRGKTLAGVFLEQFKSPFVYLLLIAAAISLGLGHTSDAAFIGAVLLLNASIGTYQEWRAETRARALKALIATDVSVRRDRRLRRLPSEQLVPGDLVQVESGERIAADLRLIESQNLAADESLLTGELLPARKSAEAAVPENATLGERATMLHAGTTVRTGRGVAVVVGTARDTAVGTLAATLQQPEQPPPLVRRMERFTRHLGAAMIGLIVVFAGLEAIRGAGLVRDFPACDCARRCRDPGRLAGRDDRGAVGCDAPHGLAQRRRPPASGRRGARRLHADRHRQDRDPDGQSADGRTRLDGGQR